MKKPSEILTKKKAHASEERDIDQEHGSVDKDNKPKKNALIDFIAKNKKPTK